MKTYAQNVANALIKIDPKGKATYEANLASYKKSLDDANSWAIKEFEPIKKADRKVLTAHDAFGYFGKRYDVTFLAPLGISEDSEPSAKNIADLIKQIKKEKVKAVFVENIKNPKLVKQIAEETGVKVSGKLYSDALSNDSEANSYIKLFKHNVEEITKALK